MATFREIDGDGIISTTSIGIGTYTLRGTNSDMARGAVEIFAMRHGLQRDPTSGAYIIRSLLIHGRVIADLRVNQYFREA